MVILSIILIGMVIPAGFSGQANSVVITYGETTHANTNYKSDVDSFFKSQSNLDLSNAAEKIITASDVNKIASTITGRTYDSSEIFSSALVNLKDSADLKVSVDKDKITTITGDMYLSALKSAGIKSGHVYVTSPVTATGESALAGIMNCYEEATNVKIPETVKEAANKEIYTQAEVVKDTNASSDQVSKLVDDVKETVWHKVTIWRKYAEVMAQYLKSGRRIEVSGDLKKVKFYTTQDGRVVPYADIWADEIELLDRPQPEGEVPPETEETETEDTPF
jgi:uncharacterized protein YpuA (DUF1002 family)